MIRKKNEDGERTIHGPTHRTTLDTARDTTLDGHTVASLHNGALAAYGDTSSETTARDASCGHRTPRDAVVYTVCHRDGGPFVSIHSQSKGTFLHRTLSKLEPKVLNLPP